LMNSSEFVGLLVSCHCRRRNSLVSRLDAEGNVDELAGALLKDKVRALGAES